MWTTVDDGTYAANRLGWDRDDRPEGAWLRAVELSPHAPTLSSTPSVAFARRSTAGDAAPIFHFVCAALSANVTTERIAEPAVAHEEFGITWSDQDEAFELLRRDGGGRMALARAWSGYPSTLNDGARVPLELAWEKLWALVDGRFAERLAEPADRSLFAVLWPSPSSRPIWVSDRLLELASVLGGPEMTGAIVRELASRHEAVRILAADALAAITGDDRRRDAEGRLLSLDAIVDEYRAHFGTTAP